MAVRSQVTALPVKTKPDYDFLLIGLDWPREVLNERIKQRLLTRLETQNMVGEIEGLNSDGLSWQRLEKFGLEYAWVSRYLQGKVDYDLMIEAGVSTCPSDAVEEIKSVADYISNKNGGDGCVRDIIEQVMRLHNKWFHEEAKEW